MILKGNERGNGRELANHLMRGAENEHIELHDLRGFAADDLFGAMQESEAIAKGTRCQKHLFSLSLSPPQHEAVPVEAFEQAIGRIESELGLEGQPRAIVFHEKEGRRHAHAVWSRIDGEEMKAINLPFYKRALNGIARDLYLEHGWEMPKGFRDQRQRDPFQFTREEWQQAKRTHQDPKAIKQALQECWSASDNRAAFESALRERGYFLARGDARGYVAVDWRGEIYSLSRTTGAKTKDLKERLGGARELPSVDEAKARIAEKMTPRLQAWAKEEQARAEKAGLAAQFQREQMVQRHRQVRDGLKTQQQERWLDEERKRAARTPRGLKGLWGWITGKNHKIRQENEAEIARAQARDRAEKQTVIERQLAERRNLQRQIKLARDKQNERITALGRDVARYMEMGAAAPIPTQQSKQRQRQRETRDVERSRERGSGPGFEPG
ncbi:relaxase [Paroceanicella profunda]|uniref:Relaxase n=1 Tax=Paroceanicella profunda TaxID=2579971 RepID=A0A5B8FGE4_9RHOB|nr:relaxase/mobilization nuclease domain-containing protein [Paroceanicella profunda]QDL91091.1 relaxase [Paroceanicella profunda]